MGPPTLAERVSICRSSRPSAPPRTGSTPLPRQPFSRRWRGPVKSRDEIVHASPPLPERGDDVLGEHLDLPHLLVPGHEALVEEPAEPLEVAVAADLLQGFPLPLDVVRRPRQRILDLPHPLDRPFRRWQGRVRIEWILRRVFRRAEGLPEPET